MGGHGPLQLNMDTSYRSKVTTGKLCHSLKFAVVISTEIRAKIEVKLTKEERREVDRRRGESRGGERHGAMEKGGTDKD